MCVCFTVLPRQAILWCSQLLRKVTAALAAHDSDSFLTPKGEDRQVCVYVCVFFVVMRWHTIPHIVLCVSICACVLSPFHSDTHTHTKRAQSGCRPWPRCCWARACGRRQSPCTGRRRTGARSKENLLYFVFIHPLTLSFFSSPCFICRCRWRLQRFDPMHTYTHVKTHVHTFHTHTFNAHTHTPKHTHTVAPSSPPWATSP